MHSTSFYPIIAPRYAAGARVRRFDEGGWSGDSWGNESDNWGGWGDTSGGSGGPGGAGAEGGGYNWADADTAGNFPGDPGAAPSGTGYNWADASTSGSFPGAPNDPGWLGSLTGWIGNQVSDALSHPGRTAINAALGFAFPAVGALNTFSGMLGGPTLGGALTSAFSGPSTPGPSPAPAGSVDPVADALGLSNSVTAPAAAPGGNGAGALSELALGPLALPILPAVTAAIPATSGAALPSLGALSARTLTAPSDPATYARYGAQPFGFYTYPTR